MANDLAGRSKNEGWTEGTCKGSAHRVKLTEARDLQATDSTERKWATTLEDRKVLIVCNRKLMSLLLLLPTSCSNSQLSDRRINASTLNEWDTG